MIIEKITAHSPEGHIYRPRMIYGAEAEIDSEKVAAYLDDSNNLLRFVLLFNSIAIRVRDKKKKRS